MNDQIQRLADQAKNLIPKGILGVDQWVAEYNQIFAKSIIQACIQACPHEDGRKHIRQHFGIE